MNLINEDIVSIAGIVEAIVLAPVLIDFVLERRKRRAQVNLSLELIETSRIEPVLAGYDDIITNLQDILDRARHAEAYGHIHIGNEILITGPALSGKKTLAKYIAKQAGITNIVIVHNPRNADALARAKSLLGKSRHVKTMLLLPRLDLIDTVSSETSLAQLDAIIEEAGERENILVVGTSTGHKPGGEVSNLFGTIVCLPGTVSAKREKPPLTEEVHRVLTKVTEFHLEKMLKSGFSLMQQTREAFLARVLLSAQNPAEIEDIFGHCQTTATYKIRTKKTNEKIITDDILETSIRRVMGDG